MTQIQTGAKIKYIRKLKGLKQEDVAQQINMSQQAYSRLETDNTKPTYEQLKEIMDALGVPLEDFGKWDGQFLFSKYGHPYTANGQVNHHRSPAEEDLYWQLLAQKEQENQSLKNDMAYLKTLIDRLLKTPGSDPVFLSACREAGQTAATTKFEAMFQRHAAS